ncbi:hypothetical protein HAX54_010904, partial [Datura stramonium]|nr:hypothetical protein [Datura stramonium]
MCMAFSRDKADLSDGKAALVKRRATDRRMAPVGHACKRWDDSARRWHGQVLGEGKASLRKMHGTGKDSRGKPACAQGRWHARRARRWHARRHRRWHAQTPDKLGGGPGQGRRTRADLAT